MNQRCLVKGPTKIRNHTSMQINLPKILVKNVLIIKAQPEIRYFNRMPYLNLTKIAEKSNANFVRINIVINLLVISLASSIMLVEGSARLRKRNKY